MPRSPPRAPCAPSRSPSTSAARASRPCCLTPTGKPLSERERVDTPAVPTPRAVLKVLDELRALMGNFDRVSVGFPGVIKHGITYTAVNLHPKWVNFPLQSELEKRWQKPVRVANDAAVQGYGAVKGTAWKCSSRSAPAWARRSLPMATLSRLELGHHPWREKTYEDYLGRRGLDKYGKKHWNKRLQEAIEQTAATFNWDHLYLGGGNTKKIDFKLPEDVTIVSNEDGILGGVALWRESS